MFIRHTFSSYEASRRIPSISPPKSCQGYHMISKADLNRLPCNKTSFLNKNQFVNNYFEEVFYHKNINKSNIKMPFNQFLKYVWTIPFFNNHTYF